MKRFLPFLYDVSRFIVSSSILDRSDRLLVRFLASIVLVAAAFDFIKHLEKVFGREQA
ncbi:MAG: hypothetical protein SPI65_00475 [Peptoniphilus sp.]|nr:hypothetical protein [Peptoniphilus sp.]MDY6044038.1 hypothetical protein [Peptoniphilus sp.]